MFTIYANNNKWRIVNEKGQKVLSGNGRIETGLAIAKAYGFFVSKQITNQDIGRKAA